MTERGTLEERARDAWDKAVESCRPKEYLPSTTTFASSFVRSEIRAIAEELIRDAADLDQKFGKFAPNVVLTNELRRRAANLRRDYGIEG